MGDRIGVLRRLHFLVSKLACACQRSIDAMARLRFRVIFILGFTWLGVACAQRPAVSAPDASNPALALLTLSAESLAQTRQRLHEGDAKLQPAYAALKARADKALATPPRSVTQKTRTPPSGSKNDYMSMSPYWWPNPDTPNGLPYVRRDGQRNPEHGDGAFDLLPMQRMLADARDLALAYHFSGDTRYAERAALVLRTWYLDPATRMNPHMRFAQGIPGRVEGRGIGIIDTRDTWLAIDAATLIAPSDHFSAAEQTQLRQWFTDYAKWLATDPLGRDEAAAKNNHGMFFDVQIAAYWLYTGQTEQARQLVHAAQTRRFAAQFDQQGRMPLELARTRPYHYHTFTLEAATRLALYSRVLQLRPPPGGLLPASDPQCRAAPAALNCPIDLWRQVIDGRSLRSVLDLVARTVVEPKSWPHTTKLEPTPVLAPALGPLLMAQRAYGPGTYDRALHVLRDITPDNVAWLLWATP